MINWLDDKVVYQTKTPSPLWFSPLPCEGLLLVLFFGIELSWPKNRFDLARLSVCLINNLIKKNAGLFKNVVCLSRWMLYCCFFLNYTRFVVTPRSLEITASHCRTNTSLTRTLTSSPPQIHLPQSRQTDKQTPSLPPLTSIKVSFSVPAADG